MNHPCFISDYKIVEHKIVERYRHSFNELAHHIFGIDFEKWYQNGCWNERYICCSYIWPKTG